MSWAGLFGGITSAIGTEISNNKKQREINRNPTRDTNFSRTTNRGRVSVEDMLAETIRTRDQRSVDEIQLTAFERSGQDTREAVNQIFRDYEEQALPEIFNVDMGSGTFGNTTTQMLANDAFSRAAGQAAGLRLGYATTLTEQMLGAQDSQRGWMDAMFNIDLNQFSEEEGVESVDRFVDDLPFQDNFFSSFGQSFGSMGGGGGGGGSSGGKETGGFNAMSGFSSYFG